MGKPIGRKFDNDKVRWSLIPWKEMEMVAEVLMHGADKYGDWNWRNVANIQDRYFNACMRHVMAWNDGEQYDNESNLPHLAHAVCCLLFMMWKDRN